MAEGPGGFVEETTARFNEFPEDMAVLVEDIYGDQDVAVPADFLIETIPLEWFPPFRYEQVQGYPSQVQEDLYLEELVRAREALFPVLLVGNDFIDGAHRVEAHRRAGATTVRAIRLPGITTPETPFHGRLSLEPSIEAVIKVLRDKMISSGKADSYYQINNGLCEDLAEEAVLLARNSGLKADLVQTESFTVDGEGCEWDWDLLSRFGISSPIGDQPHAKSTIAVDGGHVWVLYEGRHYDAECPLGVPSFFDLPFFARCVVEWKRLNGQFALDVETQDLRPTPQCPVPNPGKAFDATSERWDGEATFPGVTADILAIKGTSASIYGWSGDHTGRTRGALRTLLAYGGGCVTVHDVGELGSESRSYWVKMLGEKLVTHLYDELDDLVAQAPPPKVQQRAKSRDGGFEW